MKRKTGVIFISVKASYLQISCPRVPNMGRWIIYTESTKNSYKIWKICKYKGWKLRTKHFAHRILSSPLWSSEKRPVQNTKSMSCSSSSSIESSVKGTARSVSESDGVSDRVGSWQTHVFRSFEGPRRTFDASRLVLDLVVCFIFFFWVASTSFFFVRWTRYFLCCSTTRIWL